MTINLPYRIRAALYILTAIGTPVVAYLFAKGYIGNLEVTLWSAEVSVVSAMAAFNVTPDSQVDKRVEVVKKLLDGSK